MPPTVEPAQPVEETLKYSGRLKRTTIARTSYAECMDPDCPKAWTGTASMGASMNHAIGSGHKVVQHYEATYTSEPVPKKQSVSPKVTKDPQVVAEKVRRQLRDSKVTPKKA